MDLSDLIESSKPHLANCVALYQRERDTGGGLTHVTRTQRALRQYYIQRHQANLEALASVAFRKTFAQEMSAKISALVKQAEQTTDRAELERIAAEVVELDKLIKRVGNG